MLFLLLSLAQAADVSACTATETVVFGCPTKNGKRISICSANGKVQYRFGSSTTQELAYPPDGDHTKIHAEERSYAQAMATVFSFDNAGIHYEVTSSIGSGAMNAESNNFEGVYVMQNGKLIATVPCASPATVQAEAFPK